VLAADANPGSTIDFAGGLHGNFAADGNRMQ